MIKVLIVEDSKVAQAFLTHILEADPEIQVVGKAADGIEALEILKQISPDVITMDVNMPRMDGIETARQIMQTHPVPIVLVTGSYDPEHVAMTFRALEAGALAVVEKPTGMTNAHQQDKIKNLLITVKSMSEVKVVKRWARNNPAIIVKHKSATSEQLQTTNNIKLVAIGSSTGGPLALQTILAGLPKDFPVPILIVQHISAGFLHGMVEWLGKTTPVPVKIATHGEYVLPGHAYLAPDGYNMGIDKGSRIVLNESGEKDLLRPSVSYLFQSVYATFGKNVIGMLLTGMGKDGAEELKILKKSGAITIAQDKESSVVHGMPGEAIKLDAATYILAPEQIAATLSNLAKRN